ncbi:MAG TPA: SBBP repeat-containing protein, partial [Candidatus Sulfopaludibacter sp.]|nr:SBBP repeat-containing protein [Candidatus Sulfopaludibacter sp.]
AGQLEYDLEIAPGASPTRVRLRFENARRVRLDGDGSLVVETAAGELRQLPPRVVQSGRTVPAHYHLTGANQAAIRIGAYDRSRPLTIDPVLTYARYFGGSGSDSASAVGADSQGNVYVAGRSSSRDFPSTSPSSAKPTSPLIAVSSAGQKIAQLPIGNASSVTAIGGTPDGQILYAAAGSNVFYSSNGGASWRQTAALPAPIFAPISTPLTINSISVDAIDPSRAYVASNKGIFATADNGQTWGSHDYGLVANYDSSITASSVTVSQVDHTILYAATGQPNFIYKSTTAAGTWQILYPAYPGEPAPSIYSIQPIVYALLPGGSDLYVVDGNSILLKSTDGGATWQKLADQLFGTRSIQIDPVTGNILLLDNQGAQLSTDGGHTFATVNPPGAHNMDVSAAAFEGTSHTLYEAALGSVYATADLGSTWQAAALPPMNVHTMQAFGGLVFVGLDTPQATFLVKFDSTGTNLLYSTFFIGTPLDYVAAMQVDGQAEVYLAGYTMSQNFAGANRIGQPTPLPYFNSYVAKIAADGSTLVYLTILGGSKGSFVAALALDSAGAAYLTGETGSPDFPNTPNAAQPKPPSTACTRPTDFYFDIINVQAWAFAGKLSPDGTSMVYSTFLTGSCGSVGSSIAVNPAGEAFVGGTTTSPDMPFPTTAYQSTFPGPLDKTGYPNAADAGFGAHLSAAGDQVLGGTYIGGGYLTSVNALALDGSGNVLLTGSTWGIAPGATTGA